MRLLRAAVYYQFLFESRRETQKQRLGERSRIIKTLIFSTERWVFHESTGKYLGFVFMWKIPMK